MSIKDGLNWLKKQATQAPSLSNWDRDVPYWQQGISPQFSEDDYIAHQNQKAYQESLAERHRQDVLSRFPKPLSPAELATPTNPLDLQADPGQGGAPAPAVDRMVDTNNASPAIEAGAGADALPSDAPVEADPTGFDAAEFGTPASPAPQLPTSAATMAGGGEPIQSDLLNGGNGLTSSTSGGNLMDPVQGQGAQQPQQPQEPTAQLPTSAATMAGGAEPIQSDLLNNGGNNSLTPSQPTNNPPTPQQQEQPQQTGDNTLETMNGQAEGIRNEVDSMARGTTPLPQQPQQQANQSIPQAGNATVDPAVMNQGFVSNNTGNSTAQTQAMPNGSADYSRIFGKGFNAASGSASDKWLAGQADKLRTAGYSDNQISTMLDQNAWRKYGRNGQDYQVNTKRYTKPMGMKSASVSDDLWARQAGLNDDLDDLYVRRLRVGLWDKYNG